MSRSVYDTAANSPFYFQVAQGNINGASPVIKFGRAPSGVQTTATDIWSRADATPTQQIWLAPTAARIHTLVSSDAGDDGAPVGVGARTVRVWYLPDWDTAETYEDVTLNGTSGVAMTAAAVMINRMMVLTAGDTNINVGTITATAATDSTVTSQISAGQGQTQQAIYGFPSTQDLYVTHFYAAVNDATAAKGVDVQGRINDNPDLFQLTYRNAYDIQLNTSGNSAVDQAFPIPRKIEGPAIIKVQATGDAADMDLSAGFSGILINRP